MGTTGGKSAATLCRDSDEANVVRTVRVSHTKVPLCIDTRLIDVYRHVYRMKSTRRGQAKNAGGRTGVPLMIYLRGEQATRLEELCKSRRVTKTAIVQFAIERVFVDMENGQLDLPLGIER